MICGRVLLTESILRENCWICILPPQMKIVPIGFQHLPAPSPPQSPAPGPVTRSWAGETIFVCNNTIGSWGEGITIGNIIITVLLYSLFYHRDPNNILSCLTLDCKDTRHRADIRHSCQLSIIALPGVSWIWLHPLIHPVQSHTFVVHSKQIAVGCTKELQILFLKHQPTKMSHPNVLRSCTRT